MTPESPFKPIRPPEISNQIGVGAANHYVWEPGDCTRYEFVVAQVRPKPEQIDYYVTLFVGDQSGTMLLPPHAVSTPIHPSYVAAKTGLGEHEAYIFAEFLDRYFHPKRTSQELGCV